MTDDLRYLAFSALLTWAMLMTASLLRSRGWTPAGFMLARGTRDDLPEASPIAARADRAAKNMLENLVLFAALLLGARVAGVPSGQLALGAALFFWARLAYFAIYLAGIRGLRTAAWAASVAGLAMILATLL